MLQELKDHSPIDIKIVVAQIDTIPEEVTPGLTPAMQKAVEITCQRLLAELKPVTN